MDATIIQLVWTLVVSSLLVYGTFTHGTTGKITTVRVVIATLVMLWPALLCYYISLSWAH